MNLKEIFPSFSDSTTSTVAQLTLLMDEYFNSLYFGTDELSLSSYYIRVSDIFASEELTTITAPATVIINPKDIETSNKLYKLKYTCTTGETYTQTFFYKNSSDYDLSLPFPYDVGDPRNYPKTFNFNLTGSFFKQHILKIEVYDFLNEDPRPIYFIIDVKAPELNVDNPFFDDLHLIYSKIFDFDDKLFYVFESQTPNYILPVIVKWQTYNDSFVEINTNKIDIRPYRLSNPFEIDSSSINSVPLNFSYDFLNDNGYSYRNNIQKIGNKYYLYMNDGSSIELGNFNIRT